ncbi:MAG: penicillin-insensitive murein endopeptidase [Erythrobacter sp.]
MLEVFTVGGGEYIVNTFNAVAAWSGGGGYRSMIQVVFVMGLIYSLLVLAFNLNARAWLNWFLQATAIYMMLLVPTVTVKVTDRIDPGLAPAVVSNVPLGLGVMASFTSQFGDWMTRTAETVFVMPDALRMTNNGIIYGARLLEKAQTFQVTDPVFRANLDEHFKQCVFYDVLLGFKPMEDLTTSNNLWAAIGPGSPARAQKFLTRSGSTVSSSIIRCNDAYTQLNATWRGAIDADLPLFSKGAYPNLPDAIAAQRLRTDLGIIAGEMHGTATDPYAYLQQVSVMDAFMEARESFSDAGWDAYASQRADAQARNTYTSIAQQAMTWVPLLGIVLSVVFYAMFPVIFPLFLFPRTGITTLRGYGMGFFYLASWGPLYVVLHMFVMNRAASAYAAVSPTGPTLLVRNGITNVNNDIATIAGFMMMSVPFIAAGMARGAMAIAGQATSLLAPAQAAGEAAAAERTLGNYAVGNTSFQNLTSNMKQANKFDDRPSYASGYATGSFTHSDGGVETGFANGANAFDTRQAISSLAYRPTRTDGFASDIREALSEGFNRAEGLRQQASESRSATVSTGTELLESATRSASSSQENGSGFNSSVTKMNEQVRSLSEGLSDRFTMSESDSQRISRASVLLGDGSASLSGNAKGSFIGDVIGAEAAAKLAVQVSSQHRVETGETLSADQALSKVADYAFKEANSTQARQARDDFTRQTSSSSDTEVKSLSDRWSASLSDTRAYSEEASRTQEAFERHSRDFSESASRGYSLSQDQTQEFVTYAQEALRAPENSVLASTGWQPRLVTATPEQEQVKQIMLQRFMDDRVDQVRDDMGVSLPEMGRLTGEGPPIRSAAGVESFGEANIGAISARGPNVNVRENSGDASVRQEADERIGQGAFRLATEGIALGNKVDAAERQGGRLGEFVDDRNHKTLGETMPIISPIIEGAGQRFEDAKEWISDTADWAGDQLDLGGNRDFSGPVTSSLPRGGEGYRSYSPRNEQYGTEAMIGELRASSAEWSSRGGSPVNIGDISNRGGGPMRGHQGHQNGTTMDVRPFRKDSSNAPVTWQSPDYDRAEMRSYIEFMKERNPGMRVLFNDPVLVREGLTQPYKGHDNHLDIAFPKGK